MKITVTRDDDTDLMFEGELIARVSSRKNSTQERWTVLLLYRTERGNYVAHAVGMTTVKGEFEKSSATVSNQIEDVKKFFGFGWLAKELYKKAGIDTAERV